MDCPEAFSCPLELGLFDDIDVETDDTTPESGDEIDGVFSEGLSSLYAG